MQVIVVALAVLLLGSLEVPPAEALPRSPVVLEARPVPLRQDEPSTIRFRLDGDGPGGDARLDVYVRRTSSIRLTYYLDPTGRWVETITAYRRNVTPADLHGLGAQWIERERLGWTSITVWFVRAGVEPGLRSAWVFEPLVAEFFVRPAAGEGGSATMVAAALLAPVTLAAWALVLRGGR